MARPKEFDPELAVEQAQEVFWARGYEATSTEDLVRALGISRSSLYGTFRSKRELYARALRRYGDSSGGLDTALQAPGPVKERLRAALLVYLEEDLNPRQSRGCFACNAAVELGPADARVRRLVARSFRVIRGTLADTLRRAIGDGELPAGTDAEAVASGLLASLEGLRVLAKGTRDRHLVMQALGATLDAFL